MVLCPPLGTPCPPFTPAGGPTGQHFALCRLGMRVRPHGWAGAPRGAGVCLPLLPARACVELGGPLQTPGAGSRPQGGDTLPTPLATVRRREMPGSRSQLSSWWRLSFAVIVGWCLWPSGLLLRPTLGSSSPQGWPKAQGSETSPCPCASRPARHQEGPCLWAPRLRGKSGRPGPGEVWCQGGWGSGRGGRRGVSDWCFWRDSQGAGGKGFLAASTANLRWEHGPCV